MELSEISVDELNTENSWILKFQCQLNNLWFKEIGYEKQDDAKLHDEVGKTQDEKITLEEEGDSSNAQNGEEISEDKSCLPKKNEYGLVKSLTVYGEALEEAIHQATRVLAKYVTNRT